MAIFRDPATGLLRSDTVTSNTSLPPRTESSSQARTIEQLPARQDSFFTKAGRFAGNFAKEVGNFVARPLATPFAITSEELPALIQGRRPRSNAFSRWAFQNTEPETKARGYAALSRAGEAATILPELLLPGGFLTSKKLSLAQRGLRGAAIEAPFGAGLGYLDAKRRGESGGDAIKQAGAGGALAAVIAGSLPFVGAGLRKAVSPFIPELARGGSRATRDAGQEFLTGALGREASQELPGSSLTGATRRAADDVAEGILPPSVTTQVTEEAVSAVPTTSFVGRQIDIPEQAVARVVAREVAGEETAAIIGSIRRGAVDIFDEFGDTQVQRVLRALDDEVAGLGVSTERAIVRNFDIADQARIAAERTAGKVTGFKNFIGRGKAKLVELAAPIEDEFTRAQRQGGFEIRPQDSFSRALDDVLRSGSEASIVAQRLGLDEAVIAAERAGKTTEINQLLLAKHAEDLRRIRPDVELGRSAAQDRATIRALEGEVGALARKFNLVGQNLLEEGVQEGLVSREVANTLKELYPNYVPIERVFAVAEQGGFAGAGAKGSVSKQTIVQALKGSERAIEAPDVALANRIQSFTIQKNRNEVGRIMAKSQNLPGNPFGISALKNADQVAGPGKVKFHYFKDGKRQSFLIDKEYGDVIATIKPLQLGLIEKMMLAPTRLLKAGATGFNVPFTLFNAIKDQISGILNSNKAGATANPYVFLRAMKGALLHDKAYKEMVEAGAHTTSYALLRNQALSLSRIRAQAGLTSKIKHIVRNPSELISMPLEGLENFISRGEEVRRLQEFIGQKGSLLKEGASLESATQIATQKTRFVTANFYRRGEWGHVLNAALPYSGAGINSIRSFLGAARDNPAKMTAKVATFIMLPFAITTAWNLKDPKRKEAYDDIPEWEKENNLILIPPNPKKDENGRWEVAKIPLPPNVGAMVIPIRQAFEAAHGNDPKQFAGMAQALIGTTTPLNLDVSSRDEFVTSAASTFTPQIIKPGLEVFANKNFFTGAPLVPVSKLSLSPELQVRDNTSNTARLIGRQLEASPIKVENFIKSTMGTVGSQLLNFTDRATAGSGLNPDSIVGGEGILANVVRRSARATGGVQEGREYERVNELRTQGRTASANLKVQAEQLVDRIETLPPREATALKTETRRDNPALYDKVETEIKSRERGLTDQQKRIQSLGVVDGTRAQYIVELSQTMSADERAAFDRELQNKRVMSKEVGRQVEQLRRGVTLPPR